MEKIKVFLSDPQVLFREGIHFILSGEEDFEVTGETTNNEEAVTLIEANPPHVAILSMQNGKLSGLETARRLKRSVPSVTVILTSETIDEEQLFLALKCGAGACVTKGIEPDSLLEITRIVAKGNQPLTDTLLVPSLASKALIEFKDLATLSEQLDHMLAVLAPKEADILTAIAAGSKMEQVCAKLNTNEETVKRNLKSIHNKLVANDQARVLIEAAQRSLPSIMRSSLRMNGNSSDYVTKEEFNEFRDGLMERFKSFIGELKLKK